MPIYAQDGSGTLSSESSNSNGSGRPPDIQNVAADAFVRLLSEIDGRDEKDVSADGGAIQGFETEVTRRKTQPGAYDDFVDLAAVAAVRVLIYGVGCQDESRKDPAALTIYRKMRWIMRRKSGGGHGFRQDYQAGFDIEINETRDYGRIERQELANEAYDAGYSSGFEAGVQSSQSSYAEGFAAGQLSVSVQQPQSEDAAYAAGQQAERKRIVSFLEGLRKKTGQQIHVPGMFPDNKIGSRVPDAREDMWSPQPAVPLPQKYDHPKARKAGVDRIADTRWPLATCVFCGKTITQTSLLRHKKNQHAAEMAAAGMVLKYLPCFYPGCSWGQENAVFSYLTNHLQRMHHYTPPGDPNFMTERLVYISRMTERLKLALISDYGQMLNAVKKRIRALEGEHRRINPEYVSRHGLPTVEFLHEARLDVLENVLLDRQQLPYAVIELRQLARARGMRSQLRSDEGTWWEVADDLEAGLQPNDALAQAVKALPPSEEGPTVPLPADLLAEVPYVSSPGWVPRHAPRLQTVRGWSSDRGPGPASEESVVLPAGASIPRTKFEIVLPASSRKAQWQQDMRGGSPDQSDEELRNLMAEINQREDDHQEWDEDEQQEKREDTDEDRPQKKRRHNTIRKDSGG